MTKPITIIEVFSGIGAQAKALSRLPIPHEVVATMDVEKDAILSYAAMRYDLDKEIAAYKFPSKEQMVSELQAKNVGFDFQKNKYTITTKTNIDKVKQYYIADKLSKNLGDVSKVEDLPYVDLIVHSSPCQDYSLAGKGAGGDEGSNTRSSLMWESLRLIETSKPRYVLWENVAAVLSGKHRHNFIKYLERMSELGYENAFDLLNGKNFGVPQNRLRIFCVSRRLDPDDNTTRNIDDIPKSANKQVESTMKEIKDNPNIRMWTTYKFPETIPLETRLKDVLEKNVDERYYLPDDRIEKILNSTFMQEKKRIQTTDVCDTLLARDWKDPKCVPVEELEPVRLGGLYDSEEGRHQAGAIWDKDAISPTLDTMQGGNRQPFIVTEEPFIVPSRGRNPENPSDRTVGAPTEQRLEPNFSGCTNTLTSVQKDNYVCEPIVEKNLWTETQKKMITDDGDIKRYINSDVVDKFEVGDCADISFPNGYNKANRVFKGYAPAINGTTTQSSFIVKEPIIYDDYNSRISSDQDAINTLTCNCGASAERNGVKIIEAEIMTEDVVFPVMVRKYTVDCNLLRECLRDHKENSNFSNKEIAETLDVPMTKVEHWFRRDDSFAIPDSDMWFKLKELLNITTNEFDESIMTFEIKDGVYDKANRCYHVDGIDPTLTAASANEKIIEPVIVEDFYQSREPRVYTETAPTIRSERTGLKAADGEIEYPCSTRGKQVASAIRASIYKQGSRNLEENVVNGLGYEDVIEQEEPKIRWRIRKLTDKECWRLMNFSDEDNDRASKYVSASALYKQAGNSIVVACLIALMSSLFIEDGHKADVWTKYMLHFDD